MLFDNKAVVVVGADGTLGALLAGQLKARGVTIRCKEMGRDEPLQLWDAATVINAAGPRARPGLDWSDYFREHIGTSLAIVRAMKPGAHLLHLSSTAVYGARGTHIRCNSLESPLLFPMAAYAAAKYASEMALRSSCNERGINLTILRLSMVYGKGVDSALDSLRGMAARGLRLVLKPGSHRQHLLNIDLLIHGIKQACKCGPLGSQPFILADPFSVTNSEIDDAIKRIYSKAFSLALPLDCFKGLCQCWKRIPELRITMPIASLAVLAIDNEFEWQPAFQALGITPSDFGRDRTFDRYLS
jgi:nucleoside-diphosphate-sugar epimerase